jgi:hypothetical protein
MPAYNAQSRFADADDQDDAARDIDRRGQSDRAYGAVNVAHQLLREANRALTGSARARTALLVGHRGTHGAQEA